MKAENVYVILNPFKLKLMMFYSCVNSPYAHQGCIYLIKKYSNNCNFDKYCYNFKVCVRVQVIYFCYGKAE